MELLSKPEILRLLESKDPDSLFIDPLLDPAQVGEVTIDLRLGYDFFVSMLTREPSIDIGKEVDRPHRGVSTYFQETRRDLGERFVLYPGQVVISCSLEYLSVPPNVYVDVISRSSYTKLGVHMNTMIQPGFKGVAPLELFNHGNNAIELVVGARICQARFLTLEGPTGEYLAAGAGRKYFGEVRPAVSRADEDGDLDRLISINRK